MVLSLLGLFLIDGAYKDCVQPCSNNSSSEQLRGSPEEEAGKTAEKRDMLTSSEANALPHHYPSTFLGSSKATAGCQEEEAGNTGEKH